MVENAAQEIIRLRKRNKLNQGQLADIVGVSQASISRIEKEEQKPDLRLYAKIAKALKVDLSEIVPSDLMYELLGPGEEITFYAFCPNPLCDKNTFGFKKEEGTSFIKWSSGDTYKTENYNKVNFCSGCGTELVKNCSNCKQLLTDRGTKFCVSCGHKITDRPTKEEWKRIEEINKAREAAADNDIPF